MESNALWEGRTNLASADLRHLMSLSYSIFAPILPPSQYISVILSTMYLFVNGKVKWRVRKQRQWCEKSPGDGLRGSDKGAEVFGMV